MSNLLFDDRPLVVLPSLAQVLGSLDEAVILQQIHYWLIRSTNVKDGHKWVYNSMANWQKQFPWMSVSTVKRNFKKLEKAGLLITANYNQAGFDKTKWYRINYDTLDEMKQRLGQIDPTMGSSWTNGSGQVDPTNTIDYTKSTTEITSSSSNSPSEDQPVDNYPTGLSVEEDKTKEIMLEEIRKIAKFQDFCQDEPTLPTVAEWASVRFLADKLSMLDLDSVVSEFQNQMKIGTVDQPFRYLLKMMRNKLKEKEK